MIDILKNFRWLIISIILGFFISITYNLIKNNYFSSKNTTKINIFEVTLNNKIEEYFSKEEIQKYFRNIGIKNKNFAGLNIENSRKFENDFDDFQFIYEIKNGKIWYVSGILSINPDDCIQERDKRFNEYKILYKVGDNNRRLIIDDKYIKKENEFNRKIAMISYFFEDNLTVSRITCIDNREAYIPSDTDADTFKYIGELRYELINSDYGKIDND